MLSFVSSFVAAAVCVLECMKAIRTFHTFQTWCSQLWKLQRKLVENCNNCWIGEMIKITHVILGSVEKRQVPILLEDIDYGSPKRNSVYNYALRELADTVT